MSVRAFRINKIVQEESSSFNLWSDGRFIDDLFIDDQLSILGKGLIQVSVKYLEKAIEKHKDNLEDYQVRQLKKDLKDAKAHKETYILYWCK